VRSHADGRYYFLEVSANIDNALVPEVVKAATGMNLMREWARLEVADLRGEAYELPQAFESYAGLVQCLSMNGEPDASGFTDPEILGRIKSPHQAGLIVRSDSHERVAQLIDGYSRSFIDQIVGQAQAAERPALEDSNARWNEG
jgi:biotin carboxylase